MRNSRRAYRQRRLLEKFLEPAQNLIAVTQQTSGRFFSYLLFYFVFPWSIL
jgi:hypothetical protein